MEEFKKRTKILVKDKIKDIENLKIAIVGLGGVGGYVLEALARAGVNNFVLIDNDVVDITNINRQILATTKTIGKKKVDVALDRVLSINPDANIFTYDVFYTDDVDEQIKEALKQVDYIVDAIDSIASKIDLIQEANKNNKKIISSMGTGNRLKENFKIDKLSKTTYDPIAKILRKELNKGNIDDIFVLYSNEPCIKTYEKEIGSISFIPSIAGLKIAQFIINDVLENIKIK